MDFTVNEDLTGYSADELDALITNGNAILDELLRVADPSEAQVEEAEQVLAQVNRLVTESNSRATAAAERVTRMAALRNARTVASVEPGQDEEEGEEEPADEGEPDEFVDEETQEIAAVVAAAPQRAPVVVTPRANLSGKRPATPAKPSRDPIQITASAEVSGFAAGQPIADMATLGQAVVNRMRGFAPPAGIKGGQMTPYNVASFRKPFDDDLIVKPGTDDMEVLSRAADQSRLPGKSLVAAGGWCAPSETLYDFCFNATPEGLISLPEIQAARGGVRYTTGPDFATLYSGTGFTQTEAQAIAGTAKSCYEVTCPSFTEVRLDAIGLCIKVPILTNAAYPELVQATISQSLLAHQHRVSAYAITKMLAAATSVTLNAAGATTATILNSLEYLAHGLRSDYRLSMEANIEVVLPTFARALIRADLANRGGVDLLNVTDQQVDGYLSTRHLSVQYVYNWQDVTSSQEGWPATMDVLAYPAGTFVKATTDVINLSAVYDAASLNVNTYTGLFMEEGIAVFKRCFGAKKATLALCEDGSTGAADLATCFTLTA